MAKKKSQGTPIEAVELYINAYSFRAASIVLNAHPDKHLLFWPMVVNEAFALELFIKCLHRVRRRTLTGHDVEHLFERLSVPDRRRIAKYYQEIVVGHPLYAEFIAKGVLFDVESVLARSKDTFTRARYWHEKIRPSSDKLGIVSNAGVGSLCDAINLLTVELRPAWGHMAICVPMRWESKSQSTEPK